jgi:hypothetical protein
MIPADPDRTGRLERQVAYLLQHLGIDPEVAAGQPGGSTFGSPGDIFGAVPGSPPAFGTAAPAAPAAASGGYPPELLDAIQQGKLINAIKIYRGLTGASLSEAKSAVEKIARGGQP